MTKCTDLQASSNPGVEPVTQNATGTLVGRDRCVCEMLLPDSSFPAKKVGLLEDETVRLSNRVEHEMQTIEEQDIRLELLMQKLMNLTRRVEHLEKLRPQDLIEFNFELLRMEMKEMEIFVMELRKKLNGSNTHVETLYDEVRNVSKIVNELETLDKNNVLKAQRDMEALKKKILDCEKNLKNMKPPISIPLGSCQHRGLLRIGSPNLLLMNWKGSGYKYGAWGKDAAWNATKRMMYWVAPLNTDGRILESVRTYPLLYDLQMNRSPTDLSLSTTIKNKVNYTNAGQGSGMVVYNNNLYYNCYNSRDMCRINLSSAVHQRKTIPKAAYNNRYSYSGSSFQDFDFASDEKGLWVLHATDDNVGNMAVGKINVATLTVNGTWTTAQLKHGISNAFMICGVLYVTRSVSPKQEEVFYTFDTKTGKDSAISIMFEKLMERVQSLNYNPNDRKLYMYNDGFLVTYDVVIKP
uniref:Olfactomedin-like domain-containing protein n=1 Tax=Leptobrachium leishanense TaxID=445787 RepID=A0A8C5WH46_9ANUR